MEKCLRLCILPVIFSDIFLQAIYGKLTLLFGQPRSRSWKIGKNEEGCACDYDRYGTFDDESVDKQDTESAIAS
jgi:hypothetical protein